MTGQGGPSGPPWWGDAARGQGVYPAQPARQQPGYPAPPGYQGRPGGWGQWPPGGTPAPPAPPPPRRRGPWRWLIPLLVLVVAGVTVPLILTRGGAAPAPPGGGQAGRQADKQWLHRNPAVTEFTRNTWLFRDELVVARPSGIVGYERRTGSQRWRTTAPAVSGWPSTGPVRFCGASSNRANGTAMVSYGPQSAGTTTGEVYCAYVATLDLATGRLGAPIAIGRPADAADGSSDFPTGIPSVVTPDRAYVAFDKQIGAVRLADGKMLWVKDIALTAEGGVPCKVTDLAPAPGNGVYWTHICPTVHAPPLGVGRLDTAGRAVALHLISEREAGLRYLVAPQIVATDPVIVAVSGQRPGELTSSSWFVFDNALNTRHILRTRDGSQDTEGPSDASFPVEAPGAFHQRFRVTVADGVLYTVSSLAQQRQPNRLVAIDLASGEQRYARPLGDNRLLAVVAVDGADVVLAGADATGRGGQTMLRARRSDGTMLSTRTRPDIGVDPSGGPFQPTEYAYDYADGRLYATQWGTSAGAGGGDFTIG